MIKSSEFDYRLPKELIAQKSTAPRDHSRLMILNRKNQSVIHDYFYNLSKYLKPADVLVANDSRVIPARLIGRKSSKGKIEILLLKKFKNGLWETMIKGKIFPETEILFKRNLNGILIQKNNQLGKIKFNLTGQKFIETIHKIGQAPTPPYIKRISNLKEYQTVYAKEAGSAAAPTAGFHFTEKLINKLKKQGIRFEFVTLHVGLGTFQPVRTENIKEHQIHPEWAEISKATAEKLNQARQNRQRIIAVGTTSTRTLESFCQKGKINAGKKWIDTFIYPGYEFKFIDGLITNFHLPKSTLLMLVSAFAGQPLIKGAYQEAIKQKYRFYSFGDAMLIV